MEIFVAVLVLVAIVTTVVVARRRPRGVELDPPAAPPLTPKATTPPPATPPVERPPELVGTAPPPAADPELATPAEPEVQVDEALVAEVEAALADVAIDEPAVLEPEAEPEPEPEPVAPVKPRFRDRLTKARSLFSGYVGSVLSRSTIDDETWDDLEEAMIRADVGVATTQKVLDELRRRVKADAIKEPQALMDVLKADLKTMLSTGDRALSIEPGGTNVWLFVGVNGVGKTTTIGKLGKRQVADGRTVVMAAGDTFRAAAGEQLELWAHRVGADLVRGAEGGDPGAVVFDAVQRATAKGADLVLADTAGRLHTKVNLMEELRKIKRIAEREPARLSEVLLVIDATTGQNGLVQARQFTEAVDVTGVVLTKLDGTAKGGIALAIQAELGLPIKLVGLGETADDLVDFDPDEFVDALFDA